MSLVEQINKKIEKKPGKRVFNDGWFEKKAVKIDKERDIRIKNLLSHNSLCVTAA